MWNKTTRKKFNELKSQNFLYQNNKDKDWNKGEIPLLIHKNIKNFLTTINFTQSFMYGTSTQNIWKI